MDYHNIGLEAEEREVAIRVRDHQVRLAGKPLSEGEESKNLPAQEGIGNKTTVRKIKMQSSNAGHLQLTQLLVKMRKVRAHHRG
jgi:hypothetical protein